VIETPACGTSSPVNFAVSDRLSCSRPEIAVAALASPRSMFGRCGCWQIVHRRHFGAPWAFSNTLLLQLRVPVPLRAMRSHSGGRRRSGGRRIPSDCPAHCHSRRLGGGYRHKDGGDALISRLH
jgi:hypothetical protein